MPFTLTLPKLSPTMEEGTIAKWHKNEGDFVKEGELLLEVATDKATVEYNALDQGVLRKILVAEGQDAMVNQAIALFTRTAEESLEGYTPEGIVPAEEDAQEKHLVKETEQKPLLTRQPPLEKPQFPLAPPLHSLRFTSTGEEPVKASPLAKKIAKEKGLDLSSVSGTGPGGRVVEKDLERAGLKGEFRFPSAVSCEKSAGSYHEISLTPMRKAIAKRLQEAKTFIPHFYVNMEVDAEKLVSFRSELTAFGLKVTVNDCIIKACAFALRKHPRINAAFSSESSALVQFDTIDIAVAVAIEEGLITPIIRFADCKNLGQISQEVKTLAKKAKEGKLKEEEYRGGSFTISNLGMFDVEHFQAILNPPQAAILSVGGILEKPVVKEGKVVPGKVMNITLSCDHRVVDGVLAAKFLQTVKRYLENPTALVLWKDFA
jgi:pyruvate dehydrogenase E2 component (dihydrolipoamide acetyltransferase)